MHYAKHDCLEKKKGKELLSRFLPSTFELS